MRILDHDNNEIATVALYLNDREAINLAVSLMQLLVERDDPQWHAHVSNESFTTEIDVFRDFARPS